MRMIFDNGVFSIFRLLKCRKKEMTESVNKVGITTNTYDKDEKNIHPQISNKEVPISKGFLIVIFCSTRSNRVKPKANPGT